MLSSMFVFSQFMMEQSLMLFNCPYNCSYVQVVILIALLHSPPFYVSVNKDFIYLFYLFKYLSI